MAGRGLKNRHRERSVCSVDMEERGSVLQGCQQYTYS